MTALLLALSLAAAQAAPASPPRPQVPRPASPQRPAPRPTPPAPQLFTSPYSLDELRGKQAVVETTAGNFVIQLFPDAAPNHVGLFVKLAREGAYNGTIFHNVVKFAVIQGGDPLSKDPAKVSDYGQGGFNQVAAEASPEKQTAGAVSAVRIPNQPNSDGQQFFIAVTDQPTLDGSYTVFGRVVDGLEIVQNISSVDVTAQNQPLARAEITGITIRDMPPEPFAADTPADLAAYRVFVETTMGTMEMEMLGQKAPETVRIFLKRVQAGVYDGIAVHRVAPNFVIQTGALGYRQTPLTVSQQKLVFNLPPEFNDTTHVSGVVSMARGDDPGSASTSFFICTGQCQALDGQYTTFARVVSGFDVLGAIAAVPVDGETPRVPIVVTKVTVQKRD